MLAQGTLGLRPSLKGSVAGGRCRLPQEPSSPTSKRGSRTRAGAARARSPAPRPRVGGATDGGAAAAPAYRTTYKYNCWVPSPETEQPQQASRDLGANAAAGRSAATPRPRSARASAAAVVAAPGSTHEQGHLRGLVAQHLRVSEEEAARRLRQLELLLPDLSKQAASMDPSVLAKLAGDVASVTRRLLQLRLIFPEADAFKMAMREPFLVLGASRPRLERAAKELRRLLPGLNVDRLVEDQPALLDVKALRGAMKDFRREEPTLDVSQVLQLDPSMVFRFSFRHQPNISSALTRRTAAAVHASAASAESA